MITLQRTGISTSQKIKMPFTLKTFTLEEQIAATQPTGKHQATVSMILADEESEWLNQPLKGNQTLHDYDVAQSKIDLADLMKQKNTLDKKIPELQKELAKPAKEGGGQGSGQEAGYGAQEGDKHRCVASESAMHTRRGGGGRP